MPSRKYSAWLERLGPDWQLPGLLAGVDEAGRGPLAGPVVAAAVILDARQPIRGLADSKALSARQREKLFDEIRAKALACCIAEASVAEIDRLNILQATLLAMHRAVLGLRLLPQRVLVDGNRLPPLAMPALAIVKGDALVPAISAASILAKVHRDQLCQALHAAHPEYGFAQHKGYPTADHLAALRQHGACAVHRRSYAPVRAVLGQGGQGLHARRPADVASATGSATNPATDPAIDPATGQATVSAAGGAV